MSQNCPNCKADLNFNSSVTRTYINNKDDTITCIGVYDEDGVFIPDSFNGGNLDGYDLLNDSDSCSNCLTIL